MMSSTTRVASEDEDKYCKRVAMADGMPPTSNSG